MKGESKSIHDLSLRNKGNKNVEKFRKRTLESKWDLAHDASPIKN
jgi:hypothetical protein